MSMQDAPDSAGKTEPADLPSPDGNAAAAAREFPCDSCGARLEFHIGQQQLKCPYCGYEKALTFGEDEKVSEQDLEAALARLSKGEASNVELGELEITCKGCGGSVAFSGQLSATECPFCGTTSHREDAHKCESRLKVTAVVPFQVEADKAKEALKTWVKELWFAPSEFKKRGVTGKLNGIYLPYWTYDAMTFCRYEGQRGTEYSTTVGSGKNRRTVTKVRWTRVSGSFDQFFDDVTVPATKTFDHDLLGELEPWPIEKAVPFNTELLAGKQAMTYDVDLRVGFSQAKQRVETVLDEEARRRIGGDQQRVDNLAVKYSALTYKHTLFPVWMLAYRYQNESYKVMINAITGEVQGERPWSLWKIGTAVTFALAVAAYIYFKL